MENLNPETFKKKIVAKYPDGVASDGVRYADMDATDLTKRIVSKYPDGVTNDGHKYADYLPKTPEVAAPAPIKGEGGLLSKLGGRFNDAVNAQKRGYNEEINPLSAGLQTVGAIGGAVTDVAGAGLGLLNKGLRYIPGVAQVEDAATGALGGAVSGVAQSAPGQAVIKKGQEIAQAHPEFADDVKALGNIVGGASTFVGAGALKNAAAGTIGKVLGKDIVKSVADDILPELTKTSGVKNIFTKGTEEVGLLKRIRPVPKESIKKLAQVVVDNVPDYLKLKTYSDKVNAVRDTIGNLAEGLKDEVIEAGGNRIYSFKELKSKLKGLPEPLLVKGGDLGPKYEAIIEKAMEIAKTEGGKVSNLFDARKNLDNWIEKEIPNLYSSDTMTPLRIAITNVRHGINDFIADNLPENLGFRARLLEQSDLYRVLENLSPKAWKEVGSTNIGRMIDRNPYTFGAAKKLTKGAAKVAGATILGGGAAGAGYGLFQKVFGDR